MSALQIGQELNEVAQFKQVAICEHGRNKYSKSSVRQTLHNNFSFISKFSDNTAKKTG